MKRIATLIATGGVVVALTGCGGSSSGAEQAAIKQCAAGSATLKSCQCAVKQAESMGVSAQRLITEMTNDTQLKDPVVIKAALLCASD